MKLNEKDIEVASEDMLSTPLLGFSYKTFAFEITTIIIIIGIL